MTWCPKRCKNWCMGWLCVWSGWVQTTHSKPVDNPFGAFLFWLRPKAATWYIRVPLSARRHDMLLSNRAAFQFVGQDSNPVQTQTGLESCPIGCETTSKRQRLHFRFRRAQVVSTRNKSPDMISSIPSAERPIPTESSSPDPLAHTL